MDSLRTDWSLLGSIKEGGEEECERQEGKKENNRKGQRALHTVNTFKKFCSFSVSIYLHTNPNM